jgi:hypothetical protein
MVLGTAPREKGYAAIAQAASNERDMNGEF